MTAQEILDSYKQIRSYALSGVLGRGASDEVLIDWLNKAQRWIAIECEWPNPAIALTLADGTKSYPLSGTGCLRARSVIVNGSELYNYSGSEPGFYSLEEWELCFPGWRDNVQTGTPSAAMVISNTLYLCPAPDAACVATGKNYLNGISEPTPLDVNNLSAECDYPDDLAMAIPYIAIVKECEDTMETPSEEKRLIRKADEAARIIQHYRQINRAQGTRTPNSSSYYPRQRRFV